MTAEELEARFVEWARGRDDVRAAAVLGSRARSEPPADEWSDLDLVVVTREPALLLERTEWIGELGSPRITFVEPTATGDALERRVLFDGGVDVDFSVVSVDDLQRLRERGEVEDVIRRGVRIVLDKDGELQRLTQIASGPADAWTPPSAEEFAELTNDFWYHAVWAAKKLRRGELFTAKGAVDGYMKRILLRALKWHARARDPGTDTWHGGRFLEQWADAQALAELEQTFARYDGDDVRAALLATMRLFRRLATETASLLELPYAGDADDYATALVKELLTDA